MAFIAAHVATRGDPIAGNAYSLGREGGYSEVFQYVKTYGIAFILGLLWSRTREHAYGAWMLLFLYVLCDDALEIHERLGKLIAASFGYEPALGLMAKDLGELTVYGVVGVAFLAVITAAYRHSSRDARNASLGIAQLFCLLAFFGVAMDMAHSAVSGRLLKAAFVILEDGGELLAMSLICWYLVTVLERGGNAPNLLNKLRRLIPR
jgi:hypothetical protein